jgi:hypothetical protein
MSTLPYLASPGNISKTLVGIQTAATPERVSQDFVKTVLKIPGSSGDQMTSFLKRIGFTGSDGRPTDRYKRFRNHVTSGQAMADAIRDAYKDIFKRNEYANKLSDGELKGLIVEITGSNADSRTVLLIASTFKNLVKFADFESSSEDQQTATQSDQVSPLQSNRANKDAFEHRDTMDSPPPPSSFGLNIGYTINLNLPSSTDIEVFNAIFKSLKENLLSND